MKTKKSFLSLAIIFLGISVSATSQNTVNISSVEGYPGDTVSFSVSMNNADDIIAAEISIPIEGPLAFIDDSFQAVFGKTGSHDFTTTYSKGVFKVVLYSTALAAIPENVGTLFSFKVKLGNDSYEKNITPTVVLSDKYGKAVGCEVGSGSIIIRAPRIGITQSVIDYGHVPLEGDYSQMVTLTNTGNDVLDISSISCISKSVTISETKLRIASGESKDIKVTYRPLIPGVFNERLIIDCNAVNGSQTVELRADPYSVNTLQVSSVTGNSDSEVTIDISMNNMEDIYAVQCDFDLPEELLFVEGSIDLSTRSKDLKAFTSVSEGELSVFIYSENDKYIAKGEGVIASFKLLLKGRTGTYPLTPKQVVIGSKKLDNMVSGVTAGSVTINSPILDCSEEFVMQPWALTDSTTQFFTVVNKGSNDLIIDSIVFLDAGWFTTDNLPIIVSAGSSRNITVCAYNTNDSDLSTVMNLYNNDPSNGVKSITVRGQTFQPNTIESSTLISKDRKTGQLKVSMDNYTDIVGVQMDIHCPRWMLTDEIDIQLSDRCSGMGCIKSINDGCYTIILYSLDNTPINGKTGELFTLKFNCDGFDSDVPVISIDNIVLSDRISNNMSIDTQIDSNILFERPTIIKGDANGNGVVNVADISAIVSYIYGNTTVDFVFDAADVNGNDIINVSDISGVINIIFKQ